MMDVIEGRSEGCVVQGDCLQSLRAMPDCSAQCCVTSPPYWGLRDYGVDGQLGLESSPEAYVAAMVEVFREVRRVLKDDGTLWLNLGDSYAKDISSNGGYSKSSTLAGFTRLDTKGRIACESGVRRKMDCNLKPKDLVGIPWRVAFALQADGWYLRSDIIWHKPNPMPESVTDRPTKSHEYIFLMSKSERYYYDAEAIKEPSVDSWTYDQTRRIQRLKAGGGALSGGTNAVVSSGTTRNKRSVWSVNTAPFKGAHFATFPPKLICPCILAGAPEGGIVLDPFGGAATTGKVCIELGRRYVLLELNPAYVEIARRRLASTERPLFGGVQ